jgi:hypothetical protein
MEDEVLGRQSAFVEARQSQVFGEREAVETGKREAKSKRMLRYGVPVRRAY